MPLLRRLGSLLLLLATAESGPIIVAIFGTFGSIVVVRKGNSKEEEEEEEEEEE